MEYEVTSNKWHYRFLELAKHVAQWSKDSTKVGAIIVNDENVVVGMGYNGFPRGVEDSEERLTNREMKLKLVVHAEVNAILNATNSVKHCKLYVWPTMMLPAVCPECAKVVAQSGIDTVVMYENYNLSSQWENQAKYTKIIFEESGVHWLTLPQKQSFSIS